MLQPFSEHPLYTEACKRWQLCRDLLSGLSAMTAEVDSVTRHRRWLPPYPYEDISTGGAYDRRCERATLFSAFADTVERIAAKPFSQGVQVQGLPPEMDRLLDDIDGQGTSIHTLGRRHFARKVGLGASHFLVDWPDVTAMANEAGEITVAQRRGLRPFVIPVSPLHVCNWQWQMSESGAELVEVHIREDRYEVIEGEQKLVERVRVITPDAVTVYEKAETSDALAVSEYPNTLGEVPLIVDSVGCPDVAEVDDPVVAWPPLEKVAWLNLAHFQSTSMQRVTLDTLRAITPYETGCEPEEVKKPLTLGRAYRRTDTESKLVFAEPTGTGVEHGWRDLEHLEQQMERLGAQPLVRRSGTETATGRLADEAKIQSEAESWARSTERALERALGLAWRWMQTDPASADPSVGMPELSVDIVTEFAGLEGGMDAVRILVDVANAGKLPDRVLLGELQSRGMLRESLDIDEIADQIAEEQAESLRRMADQMTPEAEDDGEPSATEDA